MALFWANVVPVIINKCRKFFNDSFSTDNLNIVFYLFMLNVYIISLGLLSSEVTERLRFLHLMTVFCNCSFHLINKYAVNHCLVLCCKLKCATILNIGPTN